MPGPALHLAVELDGDGTHPAAWRRAAHSPDQLLTPRRVAHVAAVAESAGFALITLEDGVLPPGASPGPVGRIGAVERAAFVAASASTVGIAPVVPLIYAEPFHVSSQLASLDHISAGRAGWVVAEEDRPEAARAWGRPVVADAAARARESRDGVEVVRALWDSWEDDAVADSTGAPARSTPGGVRQVRHRGPQFDIDLAPTLPRSVQGHPVIFQAGDSGEGRDFTARNADVIFSAHGTDFDDALAFADDLRHRLRAVGRPDDDLRILPGTEIIIGATEEEALEKKRWIRLQQVTPATALGIAGLLWGIDLSGRDADGPLPKEDPVVAENDGSFGARRIADPRTVVAEWREKAEAHGWSLRETVIALGPQRGHVGTPSGLADKFAHFVRHGAVDGFNITPYLIPDGLDDVVDLLVPELQERGVYRTEYTGTTLREHLGLREPLTHRAATDRRQAG